VRAGSSAERRRRQAAEAALRHRHRSGHSGLPADGKACVGGGSGLIRDGKRGVPATRRAVESSNASTASKAHLKSREKPWDSGYYDPNSSLLRKRCRSNNVWVKVQGDEMVTLTRGFKCHVTFDRGRPPNTGDNYAAPVKFTCRRGVADSNAIPPGWPRYACRHPGHAHSQSLSPARARLR